MKLAWKMLVVTGVLLMLSAVLMDTTVDSRVGRIVNIGLQSQQQMLLILGGVLFLAGVMLFGIMKIKQTPEDEAKARVDAAKTRLKAQQQLSEAGSTIRGGAKGIGSFLRPAKDKFGIRMTVGLLTGLYWFMLGLVFGRSVGVALVGLALGVVACFIRATYWRVLLPVAVANILLAALTFTAILAIGGADSLTEENWYGVFVMVLLPGIASLILCLWLSRKARAY